MEIRLDSVRWQKQSEGKKRGKRFFFSASIGRGGRGEQGGSCRSRPKNRALERERGAIGLAIVVMLRMRRESFRVLMA